MHLPLKLSRLMLRKLSQKMITAQCQLNPATWFGKSTISEGDMPKLMNLGYFSEAKKELVCFGREEITLKPEKDEVVVFKSFFKAGLRFPLNKMIADVLKKFGIYLHQLTPNAIVRLSVYI
jgi:hypothetical protein